MAIPLAASGMTPSRWLILAALVLALAVPSTVWTYHRVLWFTPDGHAIAKTAAAAIYADYAFDPPPPHYPHGHIPPAVLTRLRATAYAVARRNFTGTLLQDWLQIYRRQISNGNYGSQYLSPCHVVAEHGDQISWRLTSADATAVSVVVCANGLRNTTEESFHLIRTSDGWKIDGWGGQCPSGCP